MLIATLGIACAARAGTVQLNGITFSEGSENLRIVSVTGNGTLASPFIVVEEVTDNTEAILVIDIHSPRFGSRINTIHAVGFALTKIVYNRTKVPWDYFGMELEFFHGTGSDYYDGLSFAQSAKANRPFRSDRFGHVEDLVEPRDIIRFTDGKVLPNDRATFSISVTHTAITPRFLLVQHLRRPYAGDVLKRRRKIKLVELPQSGS